MGLMFVLTPSILCMVFISLIEHLVSNCTQIYIQSCAHTYTHTHTHVCQHTHTEIWIILLAQWLDHYTANLQVKVQIKSYYLSVIIPKSGLPISHMPRGVTSAQAKHIHRYTTSTLICNLVIFNYLRLMHLSW